MAEGKIPANFSIFLLGTLDVKSSISILRGQSDILRLIAYLVCEEWWNLQIERYSFPHLRETEILQLTPNWRTGGEIEENSQYLYPRQRQICSGCPIATIEKSIAFPPLASLPPRTIPNQQDDILYINMMPINLRAKNSLPEYCQQYWPLITACSRVIDRKDRQLGFLSIDERPTEIGFSQRRGGLHVESPGFLPISGVDNSRSSGRYVPGIEHHWGNGMMMRSEYVQGGIFFGSNIGETCAVWNCRIRDDRGDVIACHGSIERLRSLLGPPTKLLEAGELVWLTDKTPHESLPVPPSTTQRRQFFRLVVGSQVTAWFADHSTPNPKVSLPKGIRIVHGNKFDIYNSTNCPTQWIVGETNEMIRTKVKNDLRFVLYHYGLGHLAEDFISLSLDSLQELIMEGRRIKEGMKDVPGLYSPGSYEFEYSIREELEGLFTQLTNDINYEYEIQQFTQLIQKSWEVDQILSGNIYQNDLHLLFQSLYDPLNRPSFDGF